MGDFEGACCFIFGVVALLCWFVVMLQPGPEFPAPSKATSGGCLGWRGLCTTDLHMDAGVCCGDRLQWSMQGAPVGTGWTVEELESEREENDDEANTGPWKVVIDRPGAGFIDAGPKNCGTATGRLYPPNWYRSESWPEDDEKNDANVVYNTQHVQYINFTAEIGEKDVRLLLSTRLQYIKTYTKGKATHSYTTTEEILNFHRREPSPWTDHPPDFQALLGGLMLMLFSLNALVGSCLLLRLRARMSTQRVNAVLEEAPPASSVPMVVLSNNYRDDGEEPETNELLKKSTTRSLLGNIKESRAKKVKARGYALHLPNLFLPLLPLMFLLGGTWSLQREHTRWGVLGCPAIDGSMGMCGFASFLALCFHALSIAGMFLLEFGAGGQGNFVRIAGTVDQFLALSRRLREEHVKLQMDGWAGHTTTTGSGKNRRSSTHTTWSGTEDVMYDKDEDFSEAMNDKMMRGHALVCINLVLQVRYKTNADEKTCTDQYNTFCSLVRTKDSETRLSLNPLLNGWPQDGRVGITNGSKSFMDLYSILIPLADFFGWGWSLRMLMEFWTVEATLLIVKEVQAKEVTRTDGLFADIAAAELAGGAAVAGAAAAAELAGAGNVVGKAGDAWDVPSNDVADEKGKLPEGCRWSDAVKG